MGGGGQESFSRNFVHFCKFVEKNSFKEWGKLLQYKRVIPRIGELVFQYDWSVLSNPTWCSGTLTGMRTTTSRRNPKRSGMTPTRRTRATLALRPCGTYQTNEFPIVI